MNTAAVASRLAAVTARIAAACAAAGRDAGVELVAVSKMHGPEAVRAAHAAGQRAFGENRVQELVAKAAALDDLADVRWHLIGSLQTNKVRDLLRVRGLVLVHSLDRRRLADELQRELERSNARLSVLLQLQVTDEPTKHGVASADAPGLADHVVTACPRLDLRGVMAMGPLDGDPRPAFWAAARVAQELRDRTGLPLPILSMGMSGDLEAGIAAGSTLVRIGTAVFGERE